MNIGEIESCIIAGKYPVLLTIQCLGVVLSEII